MTQKTIIIDASDFTLKIMKIGEMNLGGFSTDDMMILFSKNYVHVKNEYTNIHESIDVDYFGIMASEEFVGFTAEIQEMKGLVVKSKSVLPAADYKLVINPTSKFYIIHKNKTHVFIIANVALSDGCELKITNELRELLYAKIYPEIIFDSTIDAIKEEILSSPPTATDVELKTNSDPKVEDVPSQSEVKVQPAREFGLQSSIMKSQIGTLDKHLPLLEVATVYGIEVWRPAHFIKRRTEFSIYLEKNREVNAFVVSTKNNGYVIEPLAICPVTKCVRITFQKGIYAIGFTDRNNEKLVEPPINDIEMFIPNKQ